MSLFELDGVAIESLDIDEHPNLGFNFPFKIIIPKDVCENTEIVYVCNLPEDVSNECASFDEMLGLVKQDMSSIDMMHIHLCLKKGHPLVVPIIPSIKNFRPNFLGKECLKNDFGKLTDMKYKDDKFRYEDLADQHKAMMEYAIKYLNENGIKVDNKVIISGYSEGSKFASHFSILHPSIIKAVIAGGTGGAISMPISHIGDYVFNYPIGVADIPNFDFDSFKDISFFFYMGEDDKTDSAMPKFKPYAYENEHGELCVLRDECGNVAPDRDEFGNIKYIMDSKGNYKAMFSLFSDEEVNTLCKTMGVKTQERFIKQEEIYKSLGLNATFKLYPGNHRTVFDDMTKISDDIDKFLASLKIEDDIKLK